MRVHVWREGKFPTPAEVRTALAHDLARGSMPAGKAIESRPMPLNPLPSIQDVLADGDAASRDAAIEEPVPSGFYDELEPAGNRR